MSLSNLKAALYHPQPVGRYMCCCSFSALAGSNQAQRLFGSHLATVKNLGYWPEYRSSREPAPIVR